MENFSCQITGRQLRLSSDCQAGLSLASLLSATVPLVSALSSSYSDSLRMLAKDTNCEFPGHCSFSDDAMMCVGSVGSASSYYEVTLYNAWISGVFVRKSQGEGAGRGISSGVLR